MYESPILISEEIHNTLLKEQESAIMCQIKQVVDVDKEELIKALQYDRDQYEKGYQDGKTDAQKVGYWIERVDGWGDVYYECSNCEEAFTFIEGTPADNLYNHCPNCGSYNGGKENGRN